MYAHQVFDKMTTKNNLLTLFLLLSTFFVSKLSNALSNSHLTGTPPNHHHHHHHAPASEQPLAKIAIHKAVNALQESACITANPLLMGCQVKNGLFYIF